MLPTRYQNLLLTKDLTSGSFERMPLTCFLSYTFFLWTHATKKYLILNAGVSFSIFMLVTSVSFECMLLTSVSFECMLLTSISFECMLLKSGFFKCMLLTSVFLMHVTHKYFFRRHVTPTHESFLLNACYSQVVFYNACYAHKYFFWSHVTPTHESFLLNACYKCYCGNGNYKSC